MPLRQFGVGVLAGAAVVTVALPLAVRGLLWLNTRAALLASRRTP